MSRYEASIPRAACGLAAIAMTALVIGLTVVLPATTNSGVERIVVYRRADPRRTDGADVGDAVGYGRM